ncbi:hypothetical protein BASA81_010563 [Batrachochytrium salamandrivorans]|nr:hypothetical protein BASA81_010563 [Batrachochytrium salamandrivorans]
MAKRLNFDEDDEKAEGGEPEKEDVKAEDLVTKPDTELASEWGLSFAEVAFKRQKLIRSRALVPVVRLSDLPLLPPAIPTGLAAVDKALRGGGLARGEVLCLTGEHGSGKTQLCMQLCCNLVRMNSSKVLFIDTGNTFSLKRVVDMTTEVGGSLDLLNVANGLQLDSFLLHLDGLVNACEYDLVVIDSLAVVCGGGVGGKRGSTDSNRGLMGLVAGLLRRIASRHQCILIAVGGSPTWLDYLGHSKLTLNKGDETMVELTSPFIASFSTLLLSDRGLHDTPSQQM